MKNHLATKYRFVQISDMELIFKYNMAQVQGRLLPDRNSCRNELSKLCTHFCIIFTSYTVNDWHNINIDQHLFVAFLFVYITMQQAVFSKLNKVCCGGMYFKGGVVVVVGVAT